MKEEDTLEYQFNELHRKWQEMIDTILRETKIADVIEWLKQKL